MEFNSSAAPQKKRYQGNWKCSQCGTDITELPFEPDPARLDRLNCFDCHRKRMQRFRRGPRGPFRRAA